jgi:photosystem I P700 chlorophyll a apoprotein A1
LGIYAARSGSLISLSQRGLQLGHLIFVSILIGFHSYGLFVHNDTVQCLGRRGDTWSDYSLNQRPVFAILVQNLISLQFLPELGDGRASRAGQHLGSSDFLVHQVHAFTIHVTLLVMYKSISYARGSRLVPDKSDIGFRYPCDGPGRGGTCQLSPFDHLFLAAFWVYNTISVVKFHFFWKLQSDVWGTWKATCIQHLCSDFSTNSSSLNGYLRNFLWARSS